MADPNTVGTITNGISSMQNIMNTISEYLAQYGLNVLGAILILVIGRWVAKLASKIISQLLTKAKIEQSLVQFAESFVYIILLVFIILAALNNLGVETTSLIAVIGAAGLAVGLALQGSLANFAAGVLILLLRPFKVGDLVEVAGCIGTVSHIQIFNTMLNSPDNIKIILPNAKVTGENIKNYTVNGTRRVDLVIGISYGDDLRKARQVITDVLTADTRVLKDPAPTVAVLELAESSVNFVVRPWCKVQDYWNVYFDTTANVKIALDSNGITIPFPQRDVHLKQDSKITV